MGKTIKPEIAKIKWFLALYFLILSFFLVYFIEEDL